MVWLTAPDGSPEEWGPQKNSKNAKRVFPLLRFLSFLRPSRQSGFTPLLRNLARQFARQRARRKRAPRQTDRSQSCSQHWGEAPAEPLVPDIVHPHLRLRRSVALPTRRPRLSPNIRDAPPTGLALSSAPQGSLLWEHCLHIGGCSPSSENTTDPESPHNLTGGPSPKWGILPSNQMSPAGDADASSAGPLHGSATSDAWCAERSPMSGVPGRMKRT